MKTCTKCKIPKPLSEFSTDNGTKDRLYSWCVGCVKKCDRARRTRRLAMGPVAPVTNKTCPKCGITKHKGKFSIDTGGKSGLPSWCKECANAYTRNLRGKRIEDGCCNCGEPRDDPGRKKCPKCLDREQKRFAKLKMTGHCKCGKPRDNPGREKCSRCRMAMAAWAKKAKADVISKYTQGAMCCQHPGCGEARIECLTVEHVNQDGAARRRNKEWRGSGVYRKLLKNPIDPTIHILCGSCNTSAFRNFQAGKGNSPSPVVRRDLATGEILHGFA